ncbi:MAG TPA: hypothetical protein VFW73_03685 [Lacipirellulaceae bacterium]|nr:hypothetical protein [Lacipirellulaceae bacterium]
MSNEIASPETAFGYLSVLESEEHGYFGGYLIVSRLGRPLEFHCTAPIRPNRAQRILYGPTLEPYLLGEQIASALLDAAKLMPRLILTDRDATLHARLRSSVPLVLFHSVEDCSPGAAPDASYRKDALVASTAVGGQTSAGGVSRRTLILNDHRFELPPGFESDYDAVAQLLGELSQHVELAEPFLRIEEAIREAQRLGGREADTHDQAA